MKNLTFGQKLLLILNLISLYFHSIRMLIRETFVKLSAGLRKTYKILKRFFIVGILLFTPVTIYILECLDVERWMNVAEAMQMFHANFYWQSWGLLGRYVLVSALLYVLVLIVLWMLKKFFTFLYPGYTETYAYRKALDRITKRLTVSGADNWTEDKEMYEKYLAENRILAKAFMETDGYHPAERIRTNWKDELK